MSLKNRQRFMGSDPPASRPPAIAWHWRAGCEALRAGVQRFTENLSAVIPAQAGLNCFIRVKKYPSRRRKHGHPV